VLNQPHGLSIFVVATDLRELENSTEMIQRLHLQQDQLRQPTRSWPRTRRRSNGQTTNWRNECVSEPSSFEPWQSNSHYPNRVSVSDWQRFCTTIFLLFWISVIPLQPLVRSFGSILS